MMENTKFIKVIKADNDYFTTKINGEEKEIIEYYNEYNLQKLVRKVHSFRCGMDSTNIK